MPIDPITWTIIGLSFFGGAAVGYFWAVSYTHLTLPTTLTV